jgi:hypothetical protein
MASVVEKIPQQTPSLTACTNPGAYIRFLFRPTRTWARQNESRRRDWQAKDHARRPIRVRPDS